jgi:hypothetical protein
MNWEAMGIMFLILAAAGSFAALSVYLIERFYIHPAWVVGSLFVASILAVGVVAK